MIKGIGIDLIELDRIYKHIDNQQFIARILTKKEQQIYHTLQSSTRKTEFLAGRFAAKEAFAKAVGTGIGTLSFKDIEVLSNESGAPFIHVKGYHDEKIFISISHSQTYAIAQVIIAS
ncbi:holo-[acyl-carrier protein] synthase [Cerasibacillus quisquiliarum]|uniref:Holo-[acyl-carrier-protein] synthase n=1 Tax=Cerasibacillus quisquiliarum TaxID=227865 RepID=A0A511V077_9BACI|nr:holo-ACP synthase [Cerasibacillus quisquiliarum]MBB5147433.1 holo-[acyl-carrier protein] synthase [Cerasibacillus quisquiliarum]GEN32317.1 holo-[acyl-carrier-protein] synthase [Cerasibacillus quisquiliarum]